MPHSRPILRVGLSGGIASGKSTVARFLAECGALVVDADAIARQVLAPGGPAFDAVVAHFGEEILDERGEIDRPALARRVFSDPAARAALNAIVHPCVRAEAERRITAHEGCGSRPVAVFDAALLVETGAYRDFHRLIVVRCSLETQLRRLLKRHGIGRTEARARIAAQAPLEHKISVADYVIDTEGALERTRERTREVWQDLQLVFDRELSGTGTLPEESGTG